MQKSDIAQGIPVATVVSESSIFEPGKIFKVKENVTPLIKFVLDNNINAIVRLLEAGANINATTTSGNTALHYGSFMGHTEAISLLAKHGADINIVNSSGQTPLLVCVSRTLKY